MNSVIVREFCLSNFSMEILSAFYDNWQERCKEIKSNKASVTLNDWYVYVTNSADLIPQMFYDYLCCLFKGSAYLDTPKFGVSLPLHAAFLFVH